MASRIVTLLTDFGTADGFVGAMKGVILSCAPDATIVDVTHDIAAHDVREGAWALREAVATFPSASIHVAVVDPGVGSERRPVLLRSPDGKLFIGPDNGLLSLAASEAACGYHLDQLRWFRQPLSHTFHGRDIFASVAGHLAAGVGPEELGTVITSWLKLTLPVPMCRAHEIRGCVVHVDRFGNLITNIAADALGPNPRGWQVRVGDRLVGSVGQSYSEVERGTWIAYIGSSGALEIGVREGRAGTSRDAVCETEVRVCRE